MLTEYSLRPLVNRLHSGHRRPQMLILLRVTVFSACGGELQMLLDRDEVPSERQVVRLMRQILDGLVYLHSIDVAHLDIKVQTNFTYVCSHA